MLIEERGGRRKGKEIDHFRETEWEAGDKRGRAGAGVTNGHGPSAGWLIKGADTN